MRPTRLKGSRRAKRVNVRQAQDLEPAVTHRLGKELRVLVDDHGPEVKLPALELDELLIDILGRQDEVQLRERREHLAGDVFRAAADGSDTDAHAPQIRQRLDPIGIRAEEDERLSLCSRPTSSSGEPAGQSKPSCTRAKCTSHEARLATNREMFSTEPAETEVVDASFLLPGLRREGVDDLIVVTLRAPR